MAPAVRTASIQLNSPLMALLLSISLTEFIRAIPGMATWCAYHDFVRQSPNPVRPSLSKKAEDDGAERNVYKPAIFCPPCDGPSQTEGSLTYRGTAARPLNASEEQAKDEVRQHIQTWSPAPGTRSGFFHGLLKSPADFHSRRPPPGSG